MLDKTKINNLRDLLVGVVPNPVDQVKQITIALVYKFMNDMDDFNQNFAGKRIYFVNDYTQFAWSKLMDDKLTNLERLNLYADALQQIELNKDIPDVFQHIFKGAFLSYRNPETLTLFLKEISGFDYNQDSEQLGDAFEYLLSILGSQKDAGQFRTPRHIIDFMVKVIKPTKNDSILDPACGTAGFLISAFQYIRDTANLQLSEFSQVFNNIYGYDITPDMVKIALINLYLHRDTNPHIYEYDTLSNDEKWGEKFNVILANPPFMTPKGGIKPHSKFRLKATKSEVLFCDYILEHLRLNGRAGIVVPEGIIFQSGNVYKQLREMLVMGENNQGNLIAVISLPSGVFKPYSGVKTSILIIDKQAAKAKENILLVKINNDGYDLGDKRNPVTANDLPHALELIEYYQQHNQLPEDSPFSTSNAQLISKQQLKENDFNLSFDRYKQSNEVITSQYEFKKVEDICEIGRGRVISKSVIGSNIGVYPVYSSQTTNNGVFGYINTYDFDGEYITWTTDGANAGTVFYRKGKFNCTNVCGTLKLKNNIKANANFIALALNCVAYKYVVQVGNPKLMNNVMGKIEIPLPPIEMQQRIVAEIEQYQKVLDGAKLIVDNYKPKININPEWQTAKLSEVVRLIGGGTPSKAIDSYYGGNIMWATVRDIGYDFIETTERYITEEAIKNSSTKVIEAETVIIATRVGLGKVSYTKFPTAINQDLKAVISLDKNILCSKYLFWWFKQISNIIISNGNGSTVKGVNSDFINNLDIPLPPLEEQQKIVAELEHERQLVDNAKQLIDIMQNKINFTISQLWSNSNE